VYVVEQNRDSQLRNMLKVDLDPCQATKLRTVRHFNGLPMDARSVTNEILAQEGAN
jgi:2-oxoglutarate ferredoxin oxidoreductase subunit alpha